MPAILIIIFSIVGGLATITIISFWKWFFKNLDTISENINAFIGIIRILLIQYFGPR